MELLVSFNSHPDLHITIWTKHFDRLAYRCTTNRSCQTYRSGIRESANKYGILLDDHTNLHMQSIKLSIRANSTSNTTQTAIQIWCAALILNNTALEKVDKLRNCEININVDNNQKFL